jgi:hypothetical protein
VNDQLRVVAGEDMVAELPVLETPSLGAPVPTPTGESVAVKKQAKTMALQSG